MQIPSASPKSLRQPSQLARGALLSRGDPATSQGGGQGLEGAAPRPRQPLAMPRCCWRCVERSWQLLPRQNLRLRKETGGSGSGEGIDCSEDGLPLPALHSCVRGGDTSTS